MLREGEMRGVEEAVVCGAGAQGARAELVCVSLASPLSCSQEWMLWGRRTKLRAVQHKTPYDVGCVPCSLRHLPRCLTVALYMHTHLERLQLLPVCYILLSHASQQLTERLACVVSSSSGRTAAARTSVSAHDYQLACPDSGGTGDAAAQLCVQPETLHTTC